MSYFTKILTNIGELWLEKSIIKIIRISILIIILEAVAIVLTFSKLPPQIPLYYSRPWGDLQLAPSYHLFFLPGICLSFLIINSGLTVLFLKKKKFLGQCLAWTNLIVAIFSFITLIAIISISV